MGRVLESCSRNLSCAMQFVPDPRIIGREEDVKVFRPRAIRWERSVQFGLEDRQRDQQQETSSEANGEQKPAGSGGQTRGRCPVGGPALPTNHPTHPSFCPHALPSCLPPHQTTPLAPKRGSFPPPVRCQHLPLPIFRPLHPILVKHLLEFSTRC